MNVPFTVPVGPAWRRMKGLLFHPFAPGIWVSIGLAACIAGLFHGRKGESPASAVVSRSPAGGSSRVLAGVLQQALMPPVAGAAGLVGLRRLFLPVVLALVVPVARVARVVDDCIVLAIPHVSTVLLLPLLAFCRAGSADSLGRLDPRVDIFDAARRAASEPR